LQVHREIGNEHAGGNVIRLVLAVERATEPRARELDDVKARLGQRDPDHFHRLLTAGSRQLERRGLVAVAYRRKLTLSGITSQRCAPRIVVASQEGAEALYDLHVVIRDADRAAGNGLLASDGQLDFETL